MYNICLICRDVLDKNIINLNCDHSYHLDCLNLSFRKDEKKRCPYCNKIINFNNFKKKCITITKKNVQCKKFSYNLDCKCFIHINKD